MDELHGGWRALLYFGARRPWREMVIPLLTLRLPTTSSPLCLPLQLPVAMVCDHLDLVRGCHGAGQILLHARTICTRGGGGTAGPTSFFVVSNYAVWMVGGLYAPSLAGLGVCYMAAIRFIATTWSRRHRSGRGFGLPCCCGG